MKVGKGISIVLMLVALALIGTGVKLSQENKVDEPTISVNQVENALVQFVKSNYQVNVDSNSLSNQHTIKVTLQSLKDNHSVDISPFTSKYSCDLDHTYVLIELGQNSPIYYPHLSCSIFE